MPVPHRSHKRLYQSPLRPTLRAFLQNRSGRQEKATALSVKQWPKTATHVTAPYVYLTSSAFTKPILSHPTSPRLASPRLFSIILRLLR
mmetsp:Transcript_32442/g.54657  ORF Transcript_32442/g.54657 Transcript_32442/m.54657 type:complete len:89 (-) Transcript_32442:342-608(-)